MRSQIGMLKHKAALMEWRLFNAVSRSIERLKANGELKIELARVNKVACDLFDDLKRVQQQLRDMEAAR